ncbi:hypothetical protein BS47DRAFT_1330494 [Hydnum rufescens UP504]|uniref:BSD domain-containing protein n=1 Tax=Hydnum rufescens UP504 TaxID=1448309 RepID=A0A9P6DVY3_9AGAM|nr:hypothetical protein BS47DRAFT_1330494 [Hydnum rufescens UP504]
MNSLDLYEFDLNKPPAPVSSIDDSTPSGSRPISPPAAEPTLNEEVSQALGQLGRFWGGFRKQSQSAFALARKDLGNVVEQARSEFGKIATEVSGAIGAPPTPHSGESFPETPTIDVKGKGKEVPVEGDITDVAAAPSSPPASPTDGNMSTSIFARLQAQLPPNLQPAALSSALSSARATSASSLSTVNSDLAYLRSALTSNIQRAQTNLNVAQAEKLAEGYLAKSAELFNQAGEFLKDAVKVVPPSPEDATLIPVVSGSDLWLFPSPIGTTGWGGTQTDDDKNVAPPSRLPRDRDASLPTRLGHGTRSEGLLHRLKYDPDMLRLDPSQDPVVGADFAEFVREVEESGGASGEAFVSKIGQEVGSTLNGKPTADAIALIDTRDALVPTELSNETFWIRYFFRVHQIIQEEEKRKALLADAIQRDDEFSWEEDDEDEANPTAPPASVSTTTLTPTPVTDADSTQLSNRSKPSPALNSLSHVPLAPTSPRLSEDSYDLVESKVGTRQQSPASAPPIPISPKAIESKEAKVASDDGDDSDWE